jgi:arylsulfatase A-like enzyme
MRLASALLTIGLLAGACTPALPTDDQPAATWRLDLRAVSDDPAPQPRVLLEVTAADAGLWQLDPDVKTRAVSYTSGTAQGEALELRSAGELTVGLALAPEQRAVNQVAVTVRGSVSAYVVLGGKDQGGPRTVRQQAEGREEPVTLLFDLPAYEWPDEASRSLTIALHGDQDRVRLVSTALIRRPLERWLPSVQGGARMVEILGTEGRRAYGLAFERPLEVTFDASAGERLAFSHCVPRVSRGADREHALVVTVRDEHGTERRERYRVPYDWQAERLSLRGLRGSATARFELELTGGTEGVIAFGEPTLERARKGAPTVVLVTSDTHRADHLGALDNGLGVLTPALDRLAERGVLFEDCVAAANVTLPSHVALMTGTPPRDTGVVYNADFLGDGPHTLAERFREAGWVTYAAVSAAALRDARSGLGQGFDRMAGPAHGFADASAGIDRVLAWSDDAEGLPLFVWLHLFDAHTPYREEHALPHYYPQDRDPRDPSLPAPEAWKMVHAPEGARDLDYVVSLYRSEVTHLDQQLARVFAHRRLGRGILAFTADHGESLSEHGIYFAHSELYPQTLSVPLILAWPGGPRGERVTHPVEQLDLARTLLHLAGLEPGDFPGRPLSTSEPAAGPRFALAAGGLSASVFAGDWFFVLHLHDHPHQDPARVPYRRHTVELYDRSADPACLVNLAAERAEDASRLRALVIDWLLDARSMGWNVTGKAADLDALDELAELGYTTDYRDSSENLWFDLGCECEPCLAFE